VKCPGLTIVKKCNQLKCPVDCHMSRFSEWSACTKECEGGVQSRTRSIITVPKNGGEFCDVLSETQACNTGSCDRDCRLERWTALTPCTQACSVGNDEGEQEKFRHITRPTRGHGKCPKAKSRMRFRVQKCNQHPCYGDEICIADMDIVLAIDGSGSVKEDGFDVLKNYTGELVKKFSGNHFNVDKMKVGVVQFGNGEILDGGIISAADRVVDLTHDMEKVQEGVAGLKWRKGFTNMAQGVSAAMVSLGEGRARKQSVILVITDGSPSFKFQTKQEIDKARDKGIHVNFVVVRAHAAEQLAVMKEWASSPWETHLMHIPGLKALKQSTEDYVVKTIIENCPEAISEKAEAQKAEVKGYELVSENRDCPCWWQDLGIHEGPEGCKQAALTGNPPSPNFVFGKGPVAYYGGQCFGNEEKDGKCECGWVDSTFDHYRLVGSALGAASAAEEQEEAMLLHKGTARPKPAKKGH